jgi:hypothetical protein
MSIGGCGYTSITFHTSDLNDCFILQLGDLQLQLGLCFANNVSALHLPFHAIVLGIVQELIALDAKHLAFAQLL